MAPPRRTCVRLAALLGAIGAGRTLAETPEQKHGLDLKLYDQHLAHVDACLKALPESTDAKVTDCLAFSDDAIDRCDKAFGSQLEACMKEGKPVTTAVSGLMPELQQVREDLISCYDKMGIRARTVGKMNQPLSRCGITQLHTMVPEHYIREAENHCRAFVHDKELFWAHYKDTHKGDVGTDADYHELPLNLPGGRFEVVPPATGDMVDVVEFLTKSGFNTPKRLEPIWTDSTAQLSYVVLRAQHNDTALVVDQPWHIDRDTTEDIRLTVSVHKTGPEAGPLEILPTSHRFHPTLQAPVSSWPRGRAVAQLDVGDLVFYFARTMHRGTKRTGNTPRVSIDMVLHSTNRFYHQSSDRDPEKVEERYLKGEAAAKATKTFKRLWRETLDKNSQPDMTEPVYRVRGDEL
eukprot:CAMPEP_0204601310 /NCGR_PEP_ID=MMETSP0661-20131031/55950_1 /ASSEMBLY_ACC=CAM_ASM_000606 /TAXON_ID=109239 /ORGANISM="Alexandrium margalefi, Strain AMGDE01CS-322" /LENGTH=405 /DNA_ID=CAMNT_0051612161 /DNA_START=54 /DNA_END=1271 /DNA_ORIENTATION=+